MAAERRRSTQARDVVPSVHLGDIRGVHVRELATRFALGAFVSIVAAIISGAVGARLGGVFLAAPAILPASLTIVEHKEGTRKADRDAIGAVVGSLALVVFATVGESMFTRHNPALVLAAALGGWIAAGLAFYAILGLFRPDDCDKQQD